MSCAERFPSVRRIVAVLGAISVLASGLARAEVGATWIPGQPSVRLTGYQIVGIGDDPDPIPRVWHQNGGFVPGRAVLNAEGDLNGDGLPSMINDPASGFMAVAWPRNSATGFDIVISRFENGAWSVPAVVVDSTVNALDPQLALDGAGNVHLFYWEDGATPQVFHKQAPLDLSAWSVPQLVSQPGQAACRPAGTVFQGVMRVAYEVHDFGYGNTPRQVVLAKLQGGAFITEVVAITSNIGNVRPEVHAHAGRLWVDWIDAQTSGGSGELAWTRLDAQGQWEPIQYSPFANVEQRDYLVRGGVRLQVVD